MWRTTTYAMGTSSSSPTVELSSSAASDDLNAPLKDSSAGDPPPSPPPGNDGAEKPPAEGKKSAKPKKDKSVDWRGHPAPHAVFHPPIHRHQEPTGGHATQRRCDTPRVRGEFSQHDSLCGRRII